MTLGESLRKNASFLLLGFGSAVAALLLMRQSGGEPLFQPQSDFGVVIGAVLITVFLVVKDMRQDVKQDSTQVSKQGSRASKGKPNS